MMGRKPKPTKLKLLEGNPGHRKLPDNEPIPPTDTEAEPPSHLDDYALEEWKRITPGLETMGVLNAIDSNLLGAYCVSFSIWKHAEEERQKLILQSGNNLAGLIDKTSNGNRINNCLLGIVNKAAVDMLKFAAEFGLSPSVRARIGFDIGKNKKSKWTGLLGKTD